MGCVHRNALLVLAASALVTALPSPTASTSLVLFHACVMVVVVAVPSCRWQLRLCTMGWSCWCPSWSLSQESQSSASMET